MKYVHKKILFRILPHGYIMQNFRRCWQWSKTWC